MKHTTLISESEKRRILGLHENTIRKEFNLIMEQSSEELKKFFEGQKTKFKNFPDGIIVPYNSGVYEFGYEVKNGDGTKYLLIPDGTAVVDNGSGYKVQPNYTWTKSGYIDKMATKPLQTIQLSTDKLTDLIPLQSQVPGGGGNVEDISSRDLRNIDRTQKRTERKTEKEIQNRKKEIVNQCTKVFNTYSKQMSKNPEFWSKPENAKIKSQYDTFFKKVEDLGGNKIGCKDVDLNWDAIGIKFV